MFYSELVPISKFLHSCPSKKIYIYVEKSNHMQTRKENSKLIPKVFFPVLSGERETGWENRVIFHVWDGHYLFSLICKMQHYSGVKSNFSCAIENRKLYITEFSMTYLLGSHYFDHHLIIPSTTTKFIIILLKNGEEHNDSIMSSLKNSSTWLKDMPSFF